MGWVSVWWRGRVAAKLLDSTELSRKAAAAAAATAAEGPCGEQHPGAGSLDLSGATAPQQLAWW